MKRFLALISIFLIIGLCSLTSVLAQISVGVNEGDWIEYTISYAGSPPDYYPKWIKIEITNIQGTKITADLTGERLDGKSETNSGTYDLKTGVLDLLLIPAGLEVGNEFYHEDFGNITITGTEEHTYADADRTVVYSTVEQASIHWDKATGILLQADQSTDTFTQKFEIDKTNIWQTQYFGLDSTIIYVLIGAILVIIGIVIILLLKRR